MIANGKGLPAVTKQTQLVEIVGRHLAEAVAGGATAQEAMDAAAAGAGRASLVPEGTWRFAVRKRHDRSDVHGRRANPRTISV